MAKITKLATRRRLKICSKCDKLNYHKQFNKVCNDCTYYETLSRQKRQTYDLNWFV